MAKGDNYINALFDDGDRVTAAVTGGTVTGGRFVKPSGNLQSGPLLNAAAPASDGGNLQVTTCTAAAKALGVAAYDGLVADKIHVLTGPGFIVPVTAGGTVAAGEEVESDSTGRAITLASGRPNGLCVHGATVGNTAYIKLY